MMLGIDNDRMQFMGTCHEWPFGQFKVACVFL